MNNKKGLACLKLERINKSINANEDDITVRHATFSILDFSESGNHQIVTEDECLKSLSSLINKPLLCQYIPTDDYNEPNDDFGSHGTEIGVDRYGEEYIKTSTHAIGTCTNAYIGNVTNDYGEEVKCLLADYVLWADRFPNEVELIMDFYENNQSLYSSCEYYYTDYSINENGVECPQNITWSGHCILGSRSNKVEPAYKTSKLCSFNQKWNKAINSLKSNNKLEQNKINTKKEEINTMENIFLNALKSNNQLSFGDIRDKLFDNLAELMNAKEYNSMWISQYGIYDDFFIYETFEEDKYVTYKVPYTKNEDDTLTINIEEKEKVEGQYTYVSVNELENLKKSNNEKTELQSTLESKEEEIKSANEKIEELNEEIKSLNEKVTEKSTNAKENMDKFNELAEKLVSLNAQIEILKPLADKYNEEQYNKALNEAKENYKEKFKKANALEVFEEESTQELIEKSINSDETISKEAKYSLNSLIVDNIKPFEKVINEDEVKLGESKLSINEITKTEDKENLIPTDEEKIYAEEYGINY